MEYFKLLPWAVGGLSFLCNLWFFFTGSFEDKIKSLFPENRPKWLKAICIALAALILISLVMLVIQWEAYGIVIIFILMLGLLKAGVILYYYDQSRRVFLGLALEKGAIYALAGTSIATSLAIIFIGFLV